MNTKRVDVVTVVQQTRNYLALMLLGVLIFELGIGIWLLNGSAKSTSALYTVSLLLALLALGAVAMALYRTDLLGQLLKHVLSEHQQLQRVNQQLNSDLSARNQAISGLQSQLKQQAESSSDKEGEIQRLRKQIEKVESLEAAVLAVYQKDIAMPLETVFKLFGITGSTPQDARYRQQILAVISTLRSKGKLVSDSFSDPNRLRIAK